MAEARQRFEWEQTASIMALIANVNRGKGQPAVKPADLMPRSPEERKKDRVIVPMSAIKDLFMGGS